MSRSGYTDDYDDDGEGGLWRGAVASAINGKRGQALLRELADALDAMSDKSLARKSLVTADGEFCALGVLGAKRGLPITDVDPENWNAVAKLFGVAPAMIREIVFINDEKAIRNFTIIDPNHAYQRWHYMRGWVAEHIKEQS